MTRAVAILIGQAVVIAFVAWFLLTLIFGVVGQIVAP